MGLEWVHQGGSQGVVHEYLKIFIFPSQSRVPDQTQNIIQ